MPRIPDYAAAGLTLARSNTPRSGPDRSSEILADGQQALAGAVGAAVDQAVAHDDKLRYAAARSVLFQEQAAARRELEADNDYESFDKRYTERMAKARSAAAANIRGARSREIFEADAQADIDRGAEQIRGLARAKEVDQGVATLNEVLNANRTAALESKDPIERGRIVQGAFDAIDGALQKGYIKSSEAVATRDKFKQNYGEAFVSIQSPAERIKLLEDPEASVAKFIAPDRRAQLLEAAKKDNEDLRVRGESQAAFDALMAKHGTDFRAALNDARASLKDDPVLRDATETRISQEQVRVETFERQDREDAGEQAMQFLINGGKFADLPLDLKRRLKPATLISLKNFAQSGGRTVSDPATLVELSQLASDPQMFADKVDMMRYRSQLTDGDFQQYLDLQRKIRTGVVDGKASGFLSVSQARDAKLKEFFGATSFKQKNKQAQVNEFVNKFETAQRAFQQQTGKRPTTDEARKLLDDLWAEVVISEGFFGDTKKRAYELTDEDVDVPQADRDAIIRALRARGKPVTADAIRRTFEDSRREMFEKPKAPAP